MSLLFNMLFRLIIALLPRSKHLLISWLQAPSAVILEPKNHRNHQGNINQSYNEFSPHISLESCYQKSKRQQMLTRTQSNWNPFPVCGNAKWCSCYWKQYGSSLKLKNRTIIWSSNLTFQYLHKINEIRISRDISSSLFTVALLTIAKMWKQPKCLSTDEWIRKM